MLTFRWFRGKRIHAKANIDPPKLKPKLIEHFYPLLDEKRRRNEPFEITLSFLNTEDDESGTMFDAEVTVKADDLTELTDLEIRDEQVLGPDGLVSMRFAVEPESRKLGFLVAASVDGRTIGLPLIEEGQLPASASCIFLFESDLFDRQSDAARQRLILPDTITKEALHALLRDAVSRVLAEAIPAIADQNEMASRRLKKRFPHLIGMFPADTVGLIDEEAALDYAHRQILAK